MAHTKRNSNDDTVTFHTTSGRVEVGVEVARTEEEIQRGLMWRMNLDGDRGMLFVYPDVAPRAFWMKDTFIKLDIIFIDDDLKIINIIHKAMPCHIGPCRSYHSLEPARYVVEVNAGFCERHAISAGDKVSIDGIDKKK